MPHHDMMRPVNRKPSLHLAILAAVVTTVPCWAQPRAITAADYARAEKFMNYNTTGLMFHSSVAANWSKLMKFFSM